MQETTIWNLIFELLNTHRRLLVDYDRSLEKVDSFLDGKISKDELSAYFLNKNNDLICELDKSKEATFNLEKRMKLYMEVFNEQ